jgi:WD40 repeat protein
MIFRIVLATVLPLGGLAFAQQPAATPAIQPDQARLVQTLGGLDGPGFALAYSEKDGMLVAACERRSLHYWLRPALLGVRGGESQTPFVFAGHQAPITALAWNGGPLLASAGADRQILLWNMPAGTVKATLTGHAGIVRALAMSPDGQVLASAGDDKIIHIWNLADGQLLRKLEGHTDWITCLTFSPDGVYLASAGYEPVARIWELLGAGKLPGGPGPAIAPAGQINHCLALAFSPDGKQIAVGGTDMHVRIFNLADGSLARDMTGHGSAVTALAFHPSGTVVISGSKDRTVRIWNYANGQPFKVLEGHTSWVQGLTLLEQGTMIASVGADQTVRVWDLKPPQK